MNSILLISLSALIILILFGSFLIFFYLISQHNQDKQLKRSAMRSVTNFEEAGYLKFEATVLAGGSKERIAGYYVPKDTSYQLHLFCQVLTGDKLNKIPIEIGWQNSSSKIDAKQAFDEFILRYEVTRDYVNYQKIISSADDGEVRFVDDTSSVIKGIFSLKHGSLEVFFDKPAARVEIQRMLVKDWREAMTLFVKTAAGLRDKRLPNDLIRNPPLESENF